MIHGGGIGGPWRIIGDQSLSNKAHTAENNLPETLPPFKCQTVTALEVTTEVEQSTTRASYTTT